MTWTTTMTMVTTMIILGINDGDSAWGGWGSCFVAAEEYSGDWRERERGRDSEKLFSDFVEIPSHRDCMYTWMPYACTCWYSSVICLSTLNEWLRISKVTGFDNLYNVVAPLCHIHHLQVQSVPTNKGSEWAWSVFEFFIPDFNAPACGCDALL